jgi:hypothetical protein
MYFSLTILAVSWGDGVSDELIAIRFNSPTYTKQISARSTIQRPGPAAIQLHDALFALGVGRLDKCDKVRVDVEVRGDSRLAFLGRGGVRLREEGGIVEGLGASEGWGVRLCGEGGAGSSWAYER